MKNKLETVIKQVRLEGGMNYIRSALPRKNRMAFLFRKQLSIWSLKMNLVFHPVLAILGYKS